MYIFEEIRIVPNLFLRKYSESNDSNIKLNVWGVWIKDNKTQTLVDIIEDDKLISKIKSKYGYAEIAQDKSGRNVNVKQRYDKNNKFKFDYSKYINDQQSSNIFNIDTKKLKKNKFGIPILS